MWKQYPINRESDIERALHVLNKLGIKPEHIKIVLSDRAIGIFYYVVC